MEVALRDAAAAARPRDDQKEQGRQESADESHAAVNPQGWKHARGQRNRNPAKSRSRSSKRSYYYHDCQSQKKYLKQSREQNRCLKKATGAAFRPERAECPDHPDRPDRPDRRDRLESGRADPSSANATRPWSRFVMLS